MASSVNEKKPQSKTKKIISWIVTAVCILFAAIAVFLLIVTLIAKKNDSRAVEIFGYSFSVVLTDSMTGEIEAGELITVKKCAIEEAQMGQNAVYIAKSGPLEGRQVVHKIIEISDGGDSYHITTQGVKAGAPVDDPVYAENFVGIAVRHSAFWGGVAKFFSTPVNWILILAVCIGLPAIYTAVRLVIKYRKEAKKERAEESAKEREALKQEILREYENDKDKEDKT